MLLQDLAEVVLGRGCKINLKSAIQSDEYRQLHQEAHGLGLVSPEDSALVQLVGGKLADRAYQNVPWAIRRRAHTWHDGLPAQMALLQRIFDGLQSSKWRESETRQYDYNSDARCVLPAETGSWTHGRVKPNCLGVAQMLVGFARAVNAPHYLASVIRPNQETLHVLKMRLLKRTADMLRKHSYLGTFTAKVDGLYVEALERMPTNPQAHHVLVIQTEDGKWWVVDPYLKALYSLDTDTQALAQLAKGRNGVLTTENTATTIEKHLAAIETRLHIVEAMCDLIEKADDMLLNNLSHYVAFSWLCEEPITDRDMLRRTLVRARIVPDEEQEKTADLALLHVFCGKTDDAAETFISMFESPTETLTRFTTGMQRAGTDPDYKLKLAVSHVRLVLLDIMEHISELNHRDDLQYHKALEIGWATMALGVATLNHMQFEYANSRPSLHGRLATLFPSQWVMYDALVMAQQRGERIDSSLRAKWKAHLASFDGTPEHIIVPLHLVRWRQRL